MEATLVQHSSYIGRFAPSPTGPLHAGSLAAALASWLDAKAHAGQWLIRIEDVDAQRCPAGMDDLILQQLSACGLYSDGPIIRQSQRSALYDQAMQRLVAKDEAYPCACSRKDIELAMEQAGTRRQRHEELIYPGTCRQGLGGKAPHVWRFRTRAETTSWIDRRLGRQSQNVQGEIGDFVLKRADGCHAYQLAVVVDDAQQGITDLVRGEDLCDNTARQIQLQRSLGLTSVRYLHTPLVRSADGEKLSKQNGAESIDTSSAQAAAQALAQAALALGLPPANESEPLPRPCPAWIAAWRSRWCKAGTDSPSPNALKNQA